MRTAARISLLIFLPLLFSACLETHFEFKTAVSQNGEILRTNEIDGPGAFLFRLDEGTWKSRTWWSFIDDPESSEKIPSYHKAGGAKFRTSDTLPPDLDIDKSALLHWLEEQRFVSHVDLTALFARNQISVKQFDDRFMRTTVYEEVYENKMMPALVDAAKEYLAGRETQTPLLSEEAAEDRAREFVKKEILPQIHFRGDITLPGKITRTNGVLINKRTARWTFTAADLEEGQSTFTLMATSRSLRVPVLFTAAITGYLILSFIVISFLGLENKKKEIIKFLNPGQKRP